MRALIIADRSLAFRERAMLARLEVGLADEGVRVVHAVPQSVAGSLGGTGLYSTRVTYVETALPMFIRGRARALLESIQDVDESDESFDVVHAFGAGCWALAMNVGAMTDAAVLMEVWRPSLVSQAVSLAGVTRFDPPPAFVASEATISSAIRKKAPKSRIFSAPWGVHDSDDPPRTRGDRSPSIALLFDHADPKSVAAVLGGIAEVVKAVPDLLIFSDVSDPGLQPWRENGPVGRQANVWSAARKLKLLDRLTLTPDMEARREPVLQADMLVLPEASGMQRTLTLEAMAAGVPIVAAADEHLGTLIDHRTAMLVAKPSPAAWAAAIMPLLKDQAAATALGRSAQEFIRATRPASAQVTGILRAYEQILPSREAESSPS